MTRARSVLVVLPDQLRADVAGHAGGAARTPHLDALAARGVVATRCLATTPVCCPSRATLLTGAEPLTHGVIGNDLPLAESAVTMGEAAREAGRRTAYIGKWHLDGVPRSRFTPPGPRRHGFDHWRVYNCTHDYLHPKHYADDDELIETPGYEPVVQTDLLLEFLAGLAEDDAFFAVLAWGPPHDPYDAVPEQYRAQYDPDAIDQPTEELRRITADYLAAVTALDDQLGRIVTALEQSGRAADTVVVFTSDHGDMLGAHGYRKKQLPYREATVVPLVAAGGTLPAGAVVDALLPTVDLAPTVLALAGIAAPPAMSGRDRAADLHGAPSARDEVVLANYAVFDEGRRQGIPEWRALRTARHTYVEAVGRGPWLLFDDENDPAQQHNLLDSPETAGPAGELAARLARRLAEAGDPFADTATMIDLVGRRAEWDERESYGF